MTFFCYFRSLRRANLNSTQISIALDEIPSDSDISGVGDDSDNDNTYRPRREAVDSWRTHQMRRRRLRRVSPMSRKVL